MSLPPHVMATAVLYLSLLCCRLEVPGSGSSSRAWWQVFSPGTSEAELQDTARKIMAMYSKRDREEMDTTAVHSKDRAGKDKDSAALNVNIVGESKENSPTLAKTRTRSC